MKTVGSENFQPFFCGTRRYVEFRIRDFGELMLGSVEHAKQCRITNNDASSESSYRTKPLHSHHYPVTRI